MVKKTGRPDVRFQNHEQINNAFKLRGEFDFDGCLYYRNCNQKIISQQIFSF